MIRKKSRMSECLARVFGPPARMRDLHDEGFTIIEVVMASAILLTVILAVMSTVSFAATGSQQAQRRQGALNLASYRIEQAHAIPYSTVGTTVNASLIGSVVGVLPAIETTGPYTIKTNVSYAIGADRKASYKKVAVTVSWTVPMPGSVTVESAVIGGETLTGASVLVTALDLDDASLEVPGVLVMIDPSPRLVCQHHDRNGHSDGQQIRLSRGPQASDRQGHQRRVERVGALDATCEQRSDQCRHA
jgi:Tfp pilus assembly protein PilV